MSGRPSALILSALSGLTLLLSRPGLPEARADLVPPSTNVGNPGAGGVLDHSRVYPVIARRDDVADSVYIDNAVGYPSVGAVSSGSVQGSGTLIAPNVVLTAAHVFDSGAPLNTVFFTVGGSTYNAQSVVLSPTWTGFDASIAKGDDIAMIVLTSKVTNVAPASIYTGSDELGHVGIDVGFGYSGTGTGGQNVGTYGTKRAGPNSVDQFGDFFSNVSHKILLQDFDKPDDPTASTFGSTTPLAQESLITQGDSGGGMFMDFGTGPLLVGVHTFLPRHSRPVAKC